MGTGLNLRTEDMAKLGALVCDKGTYNGVRYLSEEWMRICTNIVEKDSQNYGYGIRKHSNDVYSITGMNGQGIFIDRKKKVVYAWHSERSSPALSWCFILQKLGVI